MILHVTPAERAALACLASGTLAAELARHLGVNEPEVESRLKILFARMGVTTPTEAVAAAIRRGLLAA